MNQSSASSVITIDFSFSAPVSNVSFDIFDIDTAGDNNKTSDTSFVDLAQIIGELSGSSVTPTLTATNSNFVSVDSNNAFGLDSVVQNSADATVTTSFAQDIDYFQITYGNNTSFGRKNQQLGTSNPGQQGIGIYDVQFTHEVPFKFSPALGMLLVGIVVGGNELRKRHKMPNYTNSQK